MWWVRFEIRARGVGRFGADKVFRGLALVDLSPNEAQALREEGQEDVLVVAQEALLECSEEKEALRQYLGYWPPVLYLEEIVGFLYRLPGPGEQVLLREPAEREEVGRG